MQALCYQISSRHAVNALQPDRAAQVPRRDCHCVKCTDTTCVVVSTVHYRLLQIVVGRWAILTTTMKTKHAEGVIMTLSDLCSLNLIPLFALDSLVS